MTKNNPLFNGAERIRKAEIAFSKNPGPLTAIELQVAHRKHQEMRREAIKEIKTGRKTDEV